MNISMIACVGENLELGKNNDLLWHLPGDLKYFKNVTSGKTVVMGKRTFDSLPKILPNRKNIVLMLPEEGTIDGVIVVNSIDEVLKMNEKDNEEYFIIGGASIYRQFLKYAKKLYLTEVKKEDKEAEVYFPEFDKSKYNKTILGNGNDNNIEYEFVLYEREDISE